MSELTSTAARRFPLRTCGLALSLTVGLAAVSLPTAVSASAKANPKSQSMTRVLLAEDDDEVVLPSRVASAIQRTQTAVDQAELRVDRDQPVRARQALAAVAANVVRARKAALRQVTAVPVDEEAETTPGPDSVIAVLTVDQITITSLAGLFDGLVSRPLVTAAIDTALRATAANRSSLLTTIMALDPEEAGADYADGMADTVDGYADEVANIQEALADDVLTAAGRASLTATLARSKVTANHVTAVFGGGE